MPSGKKEQPSPRRSKSKSPGRITRSGQSAGTAGDIVVDNSVVDGVVDGIDVDGDEILVIGGSSAGKPTSLVSGAVATGAAATAAVLTKTPVKSLRPGSSVGGSHGVSDASTNPTQQNVGGSHGGSSASTNPIQRQRNVVGLDIVGNATLSPLNPPPPASPITLESMQFLLMQTLESNNKILAKHEDLLSASAISHQALDTMLNSHITATSDFQLDVNSKLLNNSTDTATLRTEVTALQSSVDSVSATIASSGTTIAGDLQRLFAAVEKISTVQPKSSGQDSSAGSDVGNVSADESAPHDSNEISTAGSAAVSGNLASVLDNSAAAKNSHVGNGTAGGAANFSSLTSNTSSSTENPISDGATDRTRTVGDSGAPVSGVDASSGDKSGSGGSSREFTVGNGTAGGAADFSKSRENDVINDTNYHSPNNIRYSFQNNPYSKSNVRTSRHDSNRPSYSFGRDGATTLLSDDLLKLGFPPAQHDTVLSIHKQLTATWTHTKGVGPHLSKLADDNFTAPLEDPLSCFGIIAWYDGLVTKLQPHNVALLPFDCILLPGGADGLCPPGVGSIKHTFLE